MIYPATVLGDSLQGPPCLLYARHSSVLKEETVFSNYPTNVFIFNWASIGVFMRYHALLLTEGADAVDNALEMHEGSKAVVDWKSELYHDMQLMPVQFQKHVLNLVKSFYPEHQNFFSDYVVNELSDNAPHALLIEIKFPFRKGIKGINWGTSIEGHIIEPDSYRISTTPNLNYLMFGYDQRTPITNLESVADFADIMPYSFGKIIQNDEYMAKLFKRTALQGPPLSL